MWLKLGIYNLQKQMLPAQVINVTVQVNNINQWLVTGVFKIILLNHVS